jgi:hypothetical protein
MVRKLHKTAVPLLTTRREQLQGTATGQQPWRRAFYSLEHMKQLTPFSRSTFYREAQAGRLKLSKLAGRTGATDEDFLAWLARAT